MRISGREDAEDAAYPHRWAAGPSRREKSNDNALLMAFCPKAARTPRPRHFDAQPCLTE